MMVRVTNPMTSLRGKTLHVMSIIVPFSLRLVVRPSKVLFGGPEGTEQMVHFSFYIEFTHDIILRGSGTGSSNAGSQWLMASYLL